MIDRRTYAEKDWDALREKLDHPDRKVICPRCGNEIIYEKRGNSIFLFSLR